VSWPGHDHDGSRRSRRRNILAGFPARPLLLLTTPMFDKSWLHVAGGGVPGWDVTEDLASFRNAHAVVFHLPQVVNIRNTPKPPGQSWIGVTAESDVNYPRQADPGLLSCLDIVASYHQDSDFPINYTAPAQLHELLRPPPAKSDDALVCAFISNPHAASNREALLVELERDLPVHHYGRWHTTHPGIGRGRAAKLDVLRRYRFVLAFENAIDRDYVTEKWFDALVAGCVPVYLGAPNIADFAPATESYIDASACDAMALARQLRETAASQERYARHFAWKHRPLPTSFVRLFQDQEIPFLHRLCAWLDSERAAAARDATRAPGKRL
jgi:hypothetical protein